MYETRGRGRGLARKGSPHHRRGPGIMEAANRGCAEAGRPPSG